jgi:hypothetical protein
MTQEEVAQRMQVSRPTVTRMLSRAHRAVAEALVHGKAICIQGGDYRVGQHFQECGQWSILEEGGSASEGCTCQAAAGDQDHSESNQ